MQLNFKWSFNIELEGGVIVIRVLVNIMPHNKNRNF